MDLQLYHHTRQRRERALRYKSTDKFDINYLGTTTVFLPSIIWHSPDRFASFIRGDLYTLNRQIKSNISWIEVEDGKATGLNH